MPDQDVNNKTCILCGEKKLKLLFSIENNNFYKCKDCKLIQMNPIVRLKSLGEDYVGFDIERYKEFIRLFRIPQYEREIEFIKKYKKEGKLLDVGCGTGGFLEIAGNNRFISYGIEPSRIAYSIARERNKVIRGELKDINFKENYFDVVTMWSVFEHVPDPYLFLNKINSIVKKNGIIAMRIPSSHGLLSSLAILLYKITFGKIKYPLIILFQLKWDYKHYYFYNLRNIKLLLEKCGFEALNYKHENSIDTKNIDCRMNYIPENFILRKMFKPIFFLLILFSAFLNKKDELILIARKNGKNL
ncbi:MAG: class I SAM-dependent methyltransferase [Acidobacteriota bacterium]